MLAAERTVELAGNDFKFRQIGGVTVRGRQTPVMVYELPVDTVPQKATAKKAETS